MGLIESIDFHVHTNRSRCADRGLSLEKVIREYESRGYRFIALTDHYYRDLGVEPFLKAREELERIETPLKVYLSVEVELADNLGTIECDHLDELKDVLDYISVAPHCKHVLPRVPHGKDPVEYCQEMLVNAAKNPDVTVILHPWDAPRELVNTLEDLPDGYLGEFAQTAFENGKLVEVSNCMSHYWVWRSDGLRESYHMLVKELLRAKAKILIGSDGHNLKGRYVEGFGQTPPTLCDTSWAVSLVKSCGGTDDDIGLP
jgi:histidinol phosphatase-like PHP family hydrolase